MQSNSSGPKYVMLQYFFIQESFNFSEYLIIFSAKNSKYVSVCLSLFYDLVVFDGP